MKTASTLNPIIEIIHNKSKIDEKFLNKEFYREGFNELKKHLDIPVTQALEKGDVHYTTVRGLKDYNCIIKSTASLKKTKQALNALINYFEQNINTTLTADEPI